VELKATIKLEELDLESPEAGWRNYNIRRREELDEDFLDDLFGKTLLCGISVLKRLTFDGLYVIDDGYHCGHSLVGLRAKWVDNPSETPKGRPWDPNLVKVFEDGLKNVPVMEYPDDARSMRKLYQAGRHQAESNKFQFTPAHECATCGGTALEAVGNKKEAAVTYLQTYLGGTSRSTAYRWIAAASVWKAAPTLVAKLEDMPYLRTGYTLTNPFFVSAQVKERLVEGFAVAALDILYQDAQDNEEKRVPTMATNKFRDSICRSMKVLELWNKKTLHKYGKVARESQALERVVAHLSSYVGIQKVIACVNTGTPLDGTSDENIGIRECRELTKGFQQVLSGSAPPAAGGNTVGAVPGAGGANGVLPPSGLDGGAAGSGAAAGVLDEETVTLAALLGKSETAVSDEDMQLITAAREAMDGICCSRTRAALLDRMNEYSTRNVTVLIDAPTSRKGVIAQYIDLAAVFLERSQKPDMFRILTTMHQRYNIFGECYEKLKSKFKAAAWAHNLVQMERGTAKGKPGFCWVVNNLKTKKSAVPAHVTVPRGSGKDRPGQRCLDRNCKHRPKFGGGQTMRH